jgi:hypothetical protein
MKSKRMRWARYVARMGEMRNEYSISVRKSEKKDQLEDLDLDGWLILEWTLRKWGRKLRTEFIFLRTGTSDGLL